MDNLRQEIKIRKGSLISITKTQTLMSLFLMQSRTW